MTNGASPPRSKSLPRTQKKKEEKGDDGGDGDDGSDDSEGMASRLDRILEGPPRGDVDASRMGVSKEGPGGSHRPHANTPPAPAPSRAAPHPQPPPAPKAGSRCNTPSVSLHVNHEHCINISIIMITHEHHTMITCHLLYALHD